LALIIGIASKRFDDVGKIPADLILLDGAFDIPHQGPKFLPTRSNLAATSF